MNYRTDRIEQLRKVIAELASESCNECYLRSVAVFFATLQDKELVDNGNYSLVMKGGVA